MKRYLILFALFPFLAFSQVTVTNFTVGRVTRAEAPPATCTTVADSSAPESTGNSQAMNYPWGATLFTATNSATLCGAAIHTTTGGSSVSLKLVLFADAGGGQAGAILGQTDYTNSVPTGGWLKMSFTNASLPAIVSGTSYWIGWRASAADSGYAWTAGSGTATYDKVSNDGSFWMSIVDWMMSYKLYSN